MIRALVVDLAGRELLLKLLARQYGDPGALESQRVLLERHPFTIDPLLAALWFLLKSADLALNEAASLGRLRKSAWGVSPVLISEIEAVRRDKAHPAADRALRTAIQPFCDRRQKLLARLEIDIGDKKHEDCQMEA